MKTEMNFRSFDQKKKAYEIKILNKQIKNEQK